MNFDIGGWVKRRKKAYWMHDYNLICLERWRKLGNYIKFVIIDIKKTFKILFAILKVALKLLIKKSYFD